MLFALVDPNQNDLIIQIDTTEFPVPTPLYWVTAPAGAVAYQHTYNAATQTAVAIPVPTPPVVAAQMSCTPLQYINKFTAAEQLEVVTLTMTNPQIKLFYDKLLAATAVVFNDPTLTAGMNALVALNVISQARMDEILPLSVRNSNVVVL